MMKGDTPRKTRKAAPPLSLPAEKFLKKFDIMG
jgi:hypothetical protein